MSRSVRTTLGACCDVVSGATPSTSSPQYWDGEIQWATPKDLSDLDGKFIDRTERRITREGLASCGASVLPPGCVLFSSRAPIGHVAINLLPMATNQGFKSFVPKQELVDSSYLYHWLKAKRAFLEGLGSGATFKELSKAVVSRVEIALPPVCEQRRIADILDKADAIRRKRREALALTEELLRSAFLNMFGDPVSNPKGWEVRSVDALCRDKQYGTAMKANEVGDGLPVLRMNNITYSGEIDLHDLKWVRLSSAEQTKLDLRDGDVLFNRVNSHELVGKTAVWHHGEGYTFAGYLIRLRMKAEAAVGEYVSDAMNLPSMKRMLRNMAKPSINMANISGSDLRRLRMPVPPVEAQRQYKRFRETLQALRADHDEHLRATDELFRSLMARSFSESVEPPC